MLWRTLIPCGHLIHERCWLRTLALRPSLDTPPTCPKCTAVTTRVQSAWWFGCRSGAPASVRLEACAVVRLQAAARGYHVRKSRQSRHGSEGHLSEDELAGIDELAGADDDDDASPAREHDDESRTTQELVALTEELGAANLGANRMREIIAKRRALTQTPESSMRERMDMREALYGSGQAAPLPAGGECGGAVVGAGSESVLSAASTSRLVPSSLEPIPAHVATHRAETAGGEAGALAQRGSIKRARAKDRLVD